jgi:hypothetical protein
MNTLRNRLRQTSPMLYESLEKSWEIAWENWFPAISPQKGSYNSYPHIRNLEIYLNKLVLAYESKTGNTNSLISDLEIYVILSCILLHDIGRAIPSGFHWEESRNVIEEHWAILGIPSYELALSIGKICAAHDFRPEKKNYDLDSLTTIVIDPYGKIREREIGALLILCDHLDGSVNRVIAEFLLREERDSIGAFRSKIRGVDIDLNGGLIKVVLGDKWQDDECNNNPPANMELIEFSLNDKLFDIDRIRTKPMGIEDYLSEDIPAETREYLKNVRLSDNNGKFTVKKSSIIINLLKTEEKPDIYNSIWKDEYNFGILDFLVANKVIYVNRVKQKPGYVEKFLGSDFSDDNDSIEKQFLQKNNLLGKKKFGKNISTEIKYLATIFAERWKSRKKKSTYSNDSQKNAEIPKPFILATLLGNTRENVQTLLMITEILQSMGLPISGWCIEYNDHLYNWKGQETYEPIFSKEFLIETLKAMWELSTRIFGANKLSYESLSSHLREPDIIKVKRAVKRINIISTDQGSDSRESDAFWISENYWRWNVSNRNREPENRKSDVKLNENNSCKFEKYGDLKDKLEKIKSPDGGLK